MKRTRKRRYDESWLYTILVVSGIAVGALVTSFLRPLEQLPQAEFVSDPAIADYAEATPEAIGGASNPASEALIERIAELEDTIYELNLERPASRRRLDSPESQVSSRSPNFQREDQTVSRLVESGFSLERAEWIKARYDELTDQSFEESLSEEAYARTPTAKLRQELGDPEFERFWTAIGNPAGVVAWNVLADSPAALAGLITGDEILNVDGVRVFDFRELSRPVSQGAAGEQIVVDILRQGQAMQLVIPRGQLAATLEPAEWLLSVWR